MKNLAITRVEPFVSDLFFQLDLRLNSEKGGDTSTYVTNGEWHLIGEFSQSVQPTLTAQRNNQGPGGHTYLYT